MTKNAKHEVHAHPRMLVGVISIAHSRKKRRYRKRTEKKNREREKFICKILSKTKKKIVSYKTRAQGQVKQAFNDQDGSI